MTTDPLGSFRERLVDGVGGEPRRRRRRLSLAVGAAAVLAIAAGAVAVSAGGSGEQQVTADGPTTPPFDCPVTRPPEPGLEPPVGWAAHPTEGVWYGTADLWTALPSDGSSHRPRKSVWWSQHFPGGGEEEKPEVSVTWRRLDDPSAPQVRAEPPGTNAYTPGTGWFMIASEMDPDGIGCWEVTGSYKGHTLTYLYQVAPQVSVHPGFSEDRSEARIDGRVRFDEQLNCYQVVIDDLRYPIVWPPGTSASLDGRIVTLGDGTEVPVGAWVSGAGDLIDANTVISTGQAPRRVCVPSTGEVAVFDPSGTIEVTR